MMLWFRNEAMDMLPLEAGVAMNGLCEPSAKSDPLASPGVASGKEASPRSRALAARFVC